MAFKLNKKEDFAIFVSWNGATEVEKWVLQDPDVVEPNEGNSIAVF